MRKLPVTVFIVDDVKEDATRYAAVLENSIRQSAARFNAGGMQFVIDVVPVYPLPTEFADDFEARFSHILRLLDEGMKLSSLRLQAVLFDLSFALAARRGRHPTSGERLAALTRRWRPSVTRYGLTSLPLTKTETSVDLLKTPFKKEQLQNEASASRVARELLTDLEKRLETPTWNGLLEFSKISKISMHAMAASEARQAELSVVVDPFLDLLGDSYYQIEATSTKFPLDSLLAPSGPIRETQQMVAASFGATAAHLITNGTSTANKVTYAALVEEGDYVLVDRCCHISHHFAVAITGAATIYIEPEPSGLPGVPGQVSAAAVKQALAMLLSHHPEAKLPKVISVTNCTFDGFLLDPKDIFIGVLEVLEEFDLSSRLSEITFLFDEAWFSFGYFHPRYTPYSAMGATNELRSGDDGAFWRDALNVVSTQSLHKTGFALRQASIILKNLGRTASQRSLGLMDRRFEAALKMFSTTSPSMPILASIDWARRQLDLEGAFLVEAAHDAVGIFQTALEALDPQGEVLAVCRHSGDSYDTTKVTVRSPVLSGPRLRDSLWQLSQVKVQVNKFATDTVLMMFMPGFTDRSSGLLKTAISEFVGTYLGQGLATIDDHGGCDEYPPISSLRFLDATGAVSQYPDALQASDGLRIRRGFFNHPPGAPLLLGLDAHLEQEILEGAVYVSLQYVTPYPPGFPLLLPSQVLSPEIVAYLRSLRHGEIHGLIQHQGERYVSVARLT